MAIYVDTTAHRVDISLRRICHRYFAREFLPLVALGMLVICVLVSSTLTYVPVWLLAAGAGVVFASGLSLLFRSPEKVTIPLTYLYPETGDISYLARVGDADTLAAQELLHQAWQVCEVRYPGTGDQRDAVLSLVVERLSALGTLALADSGGSHDLKHESVARVLTYSSPTEGLPFDTECGDQQDLPAIEPLAAVA